MKDLVSNQITRYLEARNVAHVFGLCGHTNIALLAALEKTFKEAKPQEREANLKRLQEHQKEIGEMWRALSPPVTPPTASEPTRMVRNLICLNDRVGEHIRSPR